MSSFMQDGATWLAGQLKAHASRTVSVTVGATTITGVKGTVARHEHEVIGAHGFLTRVLSWDWTFLTADLTGVTPRSGLVITDADGDKYESMAISDDKPPIETFDRNGIMTLIHTRKTLDA